MVLKFCRDSLTDQMFRTSVAALLTDLSNYTVLSLRLAPPLALFFAARKALRNEWTACFMSALVCVGANHLRYLAAVHQFI